MLSGTFSGIRDELEKDVPENEINRLAMQKSKAPRKKL